MKLPEAHRQLLQRFLADLTVNERSKATYHRNLLQFFLFLDHQKIELIACERATIVAYREYLLAQAEQTALSLLTANNYLNAVRRFFKWLFDAEALPEITRDLSSRISINAEYEGFKKEALAPEQVRLLLASLRQSIETATTTPQQNAAYRDYAFVLLMVGTGIRGITTTRINIEDITLLHGKPIIYVQRKGKRTKDDFVVLDADCNKAIADYLMQRFGTNDYAALRQQYGSEPLFVGHSNRNAGCQLSPDRLRQIVKKHLRHIGLNDKSFSAHSLRHTFGTLQLRLTKDIFKVAENLGHSDLKSTKRYTAKERQRQRIEDYTSITELFRGEDALKVKE